MSTVEFSRTHFRLPFMHTLFGKIFIWFFAAQILISITLFAVSSAIRTRLEPSNENWRNVVAETLISQTRAAAAAAESGQTAPLEGLLVARNKGKKPRACFFLVQDGQLKVIDQTKPFAPPLALARRALLSGKTEWENINDTRVAALAVQTARARYVLAREFPRPVFVPFRDFRHPTLAGALRALTLLATMVLVSFGLARYLAAPVATLRRATHELAEGDLAVRVAPRLGRRRDELSDLGADFDRMAARLEMLLASQGRLLGDISHELRSPLARLNVSLDLAEGEPDVSSGTLHHLARIRRESERLNDLIGQILTLDRLENGRRDSLAASGFTSIDIAPLLEDIAADAGFEARARRRDVRLTIDVNCRAAAPCLIVGDEALLRSAIENVARNAVLYTAEDSVVEISLHGSNEEIRIVVRDRGAGVPESALSDLFRPFYRVADARDRKSGGTGLGLAIAQRAIALHKGTISARNVETGLLVEIRLPRV